MFNRTRILVSSLSPLCLCVLLTACGQTGPLVLPKRPPIPSASSAGPATLSPTVSPNSNNP
ncbi:lipoprotein [Rhodoferax sp.]|uniref:LPS translocon maturation chaperone LptM n=1 Tax=Rhodoferax sp. TaxID=50421 RepID=UPI00344C4195